MQNKMKYTSKYTANIFNVYIPINGFPKYF